MQTNINSVLKNLGILDLNPAYSTGNVWGKKNKTTIDSYSPVDGKKIAAVQVADQED
ncbi:hypothetical protein [Pedobacter sp. NJ-S-72]